MLTEYIPSVGVILNAFHQTPAELADGREIVVQRRLRNFVGEGKQYVKHRCWWCADKRPWRPRGLSAVSRLIDAASDDYVLA